MQPNDRAWRSEFDAPYRDIKNQLTQKQNFDAMMVRVNALWAVPRSKAIAEATIRDITHWYSMSVLVAIRRLVDDTKGTHSVVRFLRHIKKLKVVDLSGNEIPSKEIDADILHVEAVTEPAVKLANSLVTHRSRSILVTLIPRLLHEAVPHPTYGELAAMLTELDAVMVKYGRKLFANGIDPGIGPHDRMDAAQLRDLIFREPQTP